MDMEESRLSSAPSGLRPYLSSLGAWALAFGCAVGWGSFVMPGTVFLPIGGPYGIFFGMVIGAVLMLMIGYNYHYMMNIYSDAGGTYSYSKHTFGYDHGFLSAWFLLLVFIAITWANATALPIIFRNITDGFFQLGIHYTIAGFDVYLGEILLSLSALWGLGIICMRGGRLAASLQICMAILLFVGVAIAFAVTFSAHGMALFHVLPIYPPGSSALPAIIGIVVLVPWAFAGFESISNSTEEFRFDARKAFAIMVAAVVCGFLAYWFLSILALSELPAGYGNWPPYLRDLGKMSGMDGLPTFHAIYVLMGDAGVVLLAVTACAGVVTGIVGNYIAASRLIYSMARDNLLPEWFGRLNSNHTPRNAILFIMLLSLPIPFCGRTAIGWIVDVNTLGATIAYAYTSAVAFRCARMQGNLPVQVTGGIGSIVSILFFLYFLVPGVWSASTLSTESYFIFILWSILGFAFFRYIFHRDTERRFGKSTVVWIVLLFLIFFTSMLWLREATHHTTRQVLGNLGKYYTDELGSHGVALDAREQADANFYLERQMDFVDKALTGHNVRQMLVILVALFIMLNIYNSMMQREKSLEVEKVAAEKSNKAKSTFFFNMSHDIRTPMNAIIGYAELLRKEPGLSPKALDYLSKIEASSGHLLALINDILDMSRIENGKMELEIAASDLAKVMGDVYDLFVTQMEGKGLGYRVDTEQVEDKWVMCDTKRLNRVLLNLVSNAYKFTPEGGSITVSLRQMGKTGNLASYEFRVKDTGMGMSKEFAATVFEAYTRERTASNIQGTGLGMSITKSIVDLMGGTIRVKTAPEKGTEFIINVAFPLAENVPEETEENGKDAGQGLDFTKMRLLLVEDIDMNREIATMILTEFGFQVETAENGKIAVDKVAAAKPGDYQAVLMDIQMPVMNGYDASKAIRALPNPALAAIPIIAMTANAFSEDVQAAKEAGMDDHIAKPLDVAKMAETLTRVLQSAGERNA